MYRYINRLNKTLSIFNGKDLIKVGPGETFDSAEPILDDRLTIFNDLPIVKKSRSKKVKKDGDSKT